MCGIAGKLSTSGPVDRALLDRMCSVIEHRGPDSRGVYLGDGVGIAAQRLRVIDLETGDQPVFNEDSSVVVVLNGEIYNYEELRAQLRRRGHRFSSKGDTETIVHLYEEHGPDCVRLLRGMFAFALWDARRRRLLLARDRIGKKPLFYSEKDGDFWFASEAKAILQDPTVKRTVDLEAIDCFLHYQYVPDPLCAFATLCKLPPAHALVWENGKVDRFRYWKLSYACGKKVPEPAIHERIRAELLEATRLRMRSDVPLGALLSGGVDSSAVVAAMAKQSSGRIKTFSIGFDIEHYDESAVARDVANLFDTDHHELRVTSEAMDVLPRLVWHYGEPFADPSAIPTLYLAELTRNHVTVALSGDGGDENFAGYPRYVRSRWAHPVDRVPLTVRRLAARLVKVGGSRVPHGSPAARARRLGEALAVDTPERYAGWVAYFTQRERDELYSRDFRAEVADRDSYSVIRDRYVGSDATDVVNRLLDVDVQTYLPGDLLVKMDIASMAHSLEVRSPLLDHRFMEMAASLPGELKVSGRSTKKVFKDALRPWLPARILDRPKQGFGVPVAEWLRGKLRHLPEDVLLDPRSRERGFFRESKIRQLIYEHVESLRDNSNKLWALIQLELWLRTFVDARVCAPVPLEARRPRTRVTRS